MFSFLSLLFEIFVADFRHFRVFERTKFFDRRKFSVHNVRVFVFMSPTEHVHFRKVFDEQHDKEKIGEKNNKAN